MEEKEKKEIERILKEIKIMRSKIAGFDTRLFDIHINLYRLINSPTEDGRHDGI